MPISLSRLTGDFQAIARITATPGRGATRPTFSREWGEACAYVAGEAERAGCRVWRDAFGNLRARPAALPAGERVWLCGSHLDTVPSGGDYDGVAGVLVALELLRSAAEEGVVGGVPVELVVFAEEEGPTFGVGMIGAKLWVGDLTEQGLAGFRNSAGETYVEAGRAFGVDPGRFGAERFDPAGYLGLIEVHIEQGPGMWGRGQTLAVVRAIAGRRQYRVTVKGEPNHAGATSMGDRNDALAGAAEMVLALEAVAAEVGPEAVVTVGRLEVRPGAVNVIPGEVEFSIDFRAPEDGQLAAGDRLIKLAVGAVLTRREKLECAFALTEQMPARPMSAELVEAFAKVGAVELPVTVSGALHDSAVMAARVPTVMLFVPSKGGISHNPAEFSRVEDVAEAARAVERVVRRGGGGAKVGLAWLNAASVETFVAVCGGFYEHSPWVAERAAGGRPYATVADMAAAMSRAVRGATGYEQLALIRAHPDLVGRLAREGRLTRESTAEQAAAGLAALTPGEVEQFEAYNAQYRERFGFPFVICARQNRKEAILAAFPVRLANTREAEIVTALAEIDKIARLRMLDAVSEG